MPLAFERNTVTPWSASARRSQAAVVTLQLLLLAAEGPLKAHADVLPSPFQGYGLPPYPNTTVYVNVLLNSLSSIDEVQYTFRASTIIELHWYDDSFQETVGNATAEVEQGERECAYPCNNGMRPDAPQRCCDTIFLPSIFISDVNEFPETLLYWEITSCPDETGGMSLVRWSVLLTAMYNTPMNFRAYPFDQQELHIRLRKPFNQAAASSAGLTQSMDEYELQPSAAMLRTTGSISEQVSGWSLDSIDITLEQGRENENIEVFNDVPSKDATCVNTLVNFAQNDITVVLIAIKVSRLSRTFVLNVVFPVVFIGYLALAIFMFDPEDFGARLGLLASLFIALQAIQFVMTQYNPSSSAILPIEKLVLTVYVLLAVLCVECFFVSYIAHGAEHRMMRKRRNAYFREYVQGPQAVSAKPGAWTGSKGKPCSMQCAMPCGWCRRAAEHNRAGKSQENCSAATVTVEALQCNGGGMELATAEDPMKPRAQLVPPLQQQPPLATREAGGDDEALSREGGEMDSGAPGGANRPLPGPAPPSGDLTAALAQVQGLTDALYESAQVSASLRDPASHEGVCVQALATLQSLPLSSRACEQVLRSWQRQRLLDEDTLPSHGPKPALGCAGLGTHTDPPLGDPSGSVTSMGGEDGLGVHGRAPSPEPGAAPGVVGSDERSGEKGDEEKRGCCNCLPWLQTLLTMMPKRLAAFLMYPGIDPDRISRDKAYAHFAARLVDMLWLVLLLISYTVAMFLMLFVF